MAAGRDFHEVLSGRRMCRDFLPDALDELVVERVVASALRAPSAGNTSSMDLVVLGGDDVGLYWDTTLSPQRRASFPWPGLLEAPTLVLAYQEPEAYVRRYGEADKDRSGLGDGLDAWPVPYWWVDGGAAVMAMLLAAEAEGLGALFFGQFDHEEAVASAFGVPRGRRAIGTIALGLVRPGGRSRSASAARGRPDPSSRIHPGRW